MRGPHDEDIESNKPKPERDHARERREEFLRQRGIPIPEPGEADEEAEPDPEAPKDPKKP